MTIGYVTLVHRDDGYTRIARCPSHARRLRGRALRRGHTVTTAKVPLVGSLVPDSNGCTVTLELRLVPDTDGYPSLREYLAA